MSPLVLLLVALLLWLPGTLLHRGFGVARGPWGTGRFAVEATLSLAFLSMVLLPLYLANARVLLAPVAVLAATAALAASALVARRRRRRAAVDGVATARRSGLWDGASAAEIVAFAAGLALLLPVTLAHCGANIDDWWDLSFVSGWLADGHVGFAQMALSPDPQTQASPAHPRFLWSVWLMLQALVAFVTGEQPWRVQAGPLAAATVVLVVSAQAALARALFRHSAHSSRLAAATVAMTTAWIWGTEALPLFVRGYQDKLFAAFVLAPVLLAFVLQSTADEAVAGDTAGDSRYRLRRVRALAVAAAALATVSVHSLMFTMAAFACATALLALHGRGTVAWLRAHAGVAAALLVPALYPVGQALALAVTFGEQGVSLATRDNPVVRAHLSLNRLVGADGPAWVVHPGAVFGWVALAAVVALAMAWRCRREDAGARVLLATAMVPCVLMFVPGIAALAGKLWVPWMLYRLGWMVPVAPLLAYALVTLASRARLAGRRPLAAVAFAALVTALSSSTAADRLRRGMDEHPGQPHGAPVAAAAVVYDFLAGQEGRAAVLAPPNFSELVPALSGKPVVAFPERGTLVFASDEVRAYQRLADRARFFASSSAPPERDEVAERHGVRWAVLPRRQVASGSEASWLWRFGPEVLIAARASDGTPCATSGEPRCRGWWSATRASVAAHLSPAWTIVLETRDYFVVEYRGARGSMARAQAGDSLAGSLAQPANSVRWLRPFPLTPPAPAPPIDHVLATVTDRPGALVSFALPPRYMLPSVLPVWADGPAAWEDAPAEAAITLDMGVECRVQAVEVVPHLPRERRDVLELRVDDRVVRAAALHNVGIVVPVDAARPRSSISLRAASLLGNPVSLADVRVLGDRTTCGPTWPVHRKPRAPELAVREEALLALAAGLPPGGRPLVSLARHASRMRGKEAGVRLLLEATRRQPSLVEAWIDLGFAEDELAAQAATPEQAAALRADALEAFDGAVTADSHSAWARGCAAWAQRRAGHPVIAIGQALAAAQFDPTYSDAWTILAYALGDLRLHGLAERSLVCAESIDPARNWPALARADLALARSDFEAARVAMRAWIRRHPFDEAAREKISDIAAAAAAADEGR